MRQFKEDLGKQKNLEKQSTLSLWSYVDILYNNHKIVHFVSSYIAHMYS